MADRQTTDPTPEQWVLRFSWLDEPRRVVEATFATCVIRHPSDVALWEARVRTELSRFGDDLILLIDLHELRVRPQASSRFGAARARVLEDHVRRSFRFGGDMWTKTSINTSYAIHGADSNLYPTRQAALDAIEAYLDHEMR